MLFSKFSDISIEGLSVAMPTGKIASETYNDAFGEETVSKFVEMTGVKSVSRALPHQTASDLGFVAANDVIVKSGVSREKIGMMVFISQKPDYRVPSSSFILQKRLGLGDGCSCFDVNLACSGFLYSLHTLYSMLDQSDAEYALLIAADTSHRTLSPQDRTVIMLFGDGGSAVLLKKSQLPVTNAFFTMRSDGSRFKSIITPAGAYRNIGLPREREAWSDGIVRSDYDTHMKGMDVFGFSIQDVPALIKEFLEALGTTSESYDIFALHQANLYMLKQIARKIKIPMEKIPVTLDRYGNNSSNSLPLVLTDTFGNSNAGSVRVFMSGFGGGLSWACGDVVINTDKINPIIFTDSYYEEETLAVI